MKRFLNIFLLLTTFVSCVGHEDNARSGSLRLMATPQTVDVDLHEPINFQVFHDDEDVTVSAAIWNVTDPAHPLQLTGSSILLTEAKKHTFQARYMDLESPVVDVEAYAGNSGQEENRPFFRQSLITKFTATWCVNCPKMSEAIHLAEADLPDRIVDIAIHSLDDFEIPAGADFVEACKVNAFPTTLVDMDPDTRNTIASAAILLNQISESMESPEPTCGLKIDSHTEEGSLIVDVEATITDNRSYKMATLLVRDGIVAPQTGWGTEYLHKSVLIQSLGGALSGEALGACRVGDVLSRKYRCDPGVPGDPNGVRIIVYLLSQQDNGIYTVNNVVSCPANGSLDYRYETSNAE